MGKRENRSHGLSLLLIGAIVAIAMVSTISAWAVTTHRTPAADQGRADMVIIDGLKHFGTLERPPVIFYHDGHTRALAEQNKDCRACHTISDGRMSPKFKRTEDPDKKTVMDLYHDNCIACHSDNQKTGLHSGPVTCGECHVTDAPPPDIRRPIQLDKSLHFRHTRALDNKCDTCHHQYNDQSKTLVYVKGEEGACLYCHQAQTEENRISYRLAAHAQCIDCHRLKRSRNQYAGPMECGGCHDPENQLGIEKITDIPRMTRNQPDATWVKMLPPEQPFNPPRGAWPRLHTDRPDL